MTEIEENIWKIKGCLFEDQKDINLFSVEMFLKMIQKLYSFFFDSKIINNQNNQKKQKEEC